jgi:sugar phosphate permease
VLGPISVALLVAFVMRQARISNPLMPLRLFRSRNVTGANLVMALMVVGFFGMFFLGALYLQGILDYSPLGVGVAFLPACIIMGTLSLGYAERLIMGIGARKALIAGLVISGLGLALFARAPVDGTYVTDVMPVMVLLGFGAGFSFPALMTLAMSGATRSDSGLASGFVNTTVQVGGAIGLAVLATLATDRSDSLRADGESMNAALNAGYHLAYLVGAALVATAVVIAVTVLRPEEQAEHEVEHEQAEGERRRRPAYSEAAS